MRENENRAHKNLLPTTRWFEKRCARVELGQVQDGNRTRRGRTVCGGDGGARVEGGGWQIDRCLYAGGSCKVLLCPKVRRLKSVSSNGHRRHCIAARVTNDTQRDPGGKRLLFFNHAAAAPAIIAYPLFMSGPRPTP